MSDLEASKLAAIQAHAGVRHSDEYIDEAFRQIHRQARETLDFIAGLPYAAEMVPIVNGLAFIRTRAYEALQPVTICDPPDNGIFTSPGEMAGNPSCNDINDFHTRTL